MAARASGLAQGSLFAPDEADLLPGLAYQGGFLSPEEEAHWIGQIEALPLEAMRYKSHTAKRRVLSFGGRYDFDEGRLLPTGELPEAFWPLRRKVADWAGLSERALVHVLFAEYSVGTPLGWHRDVPEFKDILGVSLAGEAVMRFKPFPPTAPHRSHVLKLVLPPRSVYRLSGAARWEWQHSLPAAPSLRYSVTFRTKA